MPTERIRLDAATVIELLFGDDDEKISSPVKLQISVGLEKKDWSKLIEIIRRHTPPLTVKPFEPPIPTPREPNP